MKKQIVLKIDKHLLDKFDMLAKLNHRNRTQEITRLIEMATGGIQVPIEKEVLTEPTTQEITFGVSDAVENEGVSDWLNDIQNSLV